jgi:predicted nucleic acid-binding protein
MRVIVDTCVISELVRPAPHPRVTLAMSGLFETELYLSAITIGELTKGIHLLQPSERRRSLESWLMKIEGQFTDQILPIDTEVARTWGEITARAAQLGRVIASPDGLIAATALRHGMHLMTRNTADFAATGVLLIDPWQ